MFLRFSAGSAAALAVLALALVSVRVQPLPEPPAAAAPAHAAAPVDVPSTPPPPAPPPAAAQPIPPVEALPKEIARPRTARYSAADRDALVSALTGFSGKTNQQRMAYIVETLFPAVGLGDARLQPVPYSGAWGEDYGSWEGLQNVYALRPGSLPDGQRRRILVGGHFDKVTYPWRSASPGISDGILDNGSGIATLALLAADTPAPQNDFVFVAWATEEPPPFFNGSKRYFASLPPEERAGVAAYVNFDVLGRGRLAAVVNSTPRLVAAAAERVQASGLPLARVPVSTNNNSDHLVALSYGIPVLALTCTDYSARNIHVPEDNLSVIDPETLWEQFQAARAALSALDDLVAAEAQAAMDLRRRTPAAASR